MLVSVIIPIYNAEAYLVTTLDSLLAQSHPKWEALLVNDGSQDQSGRIAKEYAERDARVRYFEQPNQGVSAARNVGLANMRGDFFCFLDADDALPPHSLRTRLGVFKLNPAIEFVDGTVEIKDADFNSTQSTWTPKLEGNPLVDLVSLTGNTFFGPSWTFRRIADRTYSFLEGHTHGEDLLFYIEQARHGGLYSYTQAPILWYRKGHSSAMSNLKGLENGYRTLYHEIKKMPEVQPAQRNYFRVKTRSIMFKSYLATGKFFSAARMLIQPW